MIKETHKNISVLGRDIGSGSRWLRDTKHKKRKGKGQRWTKGNQRKLNATKLRKVCQRQSVNPMQLTGGFRGEVNTIDRRSKARLEKKKKVKKKASWMSEIRETKKDVNWWMGLMNRWTNACTRNKKRNKKTTREQTDTRTRIKEGKRNKKRLELKTSFRKDEQRNSELTIVGVSGK